jgi:ribosomal protein S18 acetylase RimI-like enzyme
MCGLKLAQITTSSGCVIESRLYTSESDLVQILDMLMTGRAQTNDWRYWHVGELLFNFFMVLCHLDPCKFIRLWHDDRGRLAGYAILGEDPSFDCQVLPEYAWIGIESQALDWLEARLVGLRRQDARQWGGPLVSGARQDDPQRIAFLEQRGFSYRGQFSEVNMLRSLAEPVPEPVIPAGCQVRPVAETPVEIARHAAIQRAVWLPWTVGNISDQDYALFMRMPGYQRDLDLVTVMPDGEFAAYVTGWIDPLNRIGDFGPVGAHPDYRRQGFTRAALLEGMRRMKACGMERVCISTGFENIPALRLYESLGFRVVNRYLDYVKAY